MNRQLTSNLMMIRPGCFSSNSETIDTNQFQSSVGINDNLSSIRNQAIIEFDNMVKILRSNNLNIIVFDDDLILNNADAVFPNNWVTFHQNNRAVIYPMMSQSRRSEKRLELLDLMTSEYFYNIEEIIDLSYLEQNNIFLEGTGSVIFDRLNKIFFACLSPRTNYQALEILAKEIDYDFISFKAFNRSLPIYHTNVMMSLGEKLAFICLDAIEDKETAKKILSRIQQNEREVIEISIDQMNYFCGNVLEVSNTNDESIIIMSKSASNSLTSGQKNKINQYSRAIEIPINTIEKYGGGSTRCMIAEVFLNKIDG